VVSDRIAVGSLEEWQQYWSKQLGHAGMMFPNRADVIINNTTILLQKYLVLNLVFFRLSTSSFEVSPVFLLPTRSCSIGQQDADESGNIDVGRRRLPVVLFDMSDVQTTTTCPEGGERQSPATDHGHLAAYDDNDTDGQRRWSTGSGRPAGEHLLRTARKSISMINDYLSSRLPAVGGLMYGRRERSATKRERKATKTLAVVLGKETRQHVLAYV